MPLKARSFVALTVAVLAMTPSLVLAQDPSTPAAPATPAPQTGQPAVIEPPGNSPPLFRTLQLQFHPVDESLIEPQTYLYYIQSQNLVSRPSAGVFNPFNEDTERVLLEDFKRLWATNFLDDLRVEVLDQPWPNGVLGKHVIFHLEERPRVKIIDYPEKVDRSKLDEKMKEANVSMRLDSFLDEGVIRRVEGILRNLMAEKGHQFAEVKHRVEELPGGPKLARVVFEAAEGPKVKVRDIEFIGNRRSVTVP